MHSRAANKKKRTLSWDWNHSDCLLSLVHVLDNISDYLKREWKKNVDFSIFAEISEGALFLFFYSSHANEKDSV